MMLYVLSIAAAIFLIVLLFRSTDDIPTRWTGSVIVVLGTFFLMLYLSGITGVGLSEQIVNWFERGGMSA